MLNTRVSMREGTDERTYTTTKHITTLLLCSRVKKKVHKARRMINKPLLHIWGICSGSPQSHIPRLHSHTDVDPALHNQLATTFAYLQELLWVDYVK